MSGGFRNWIIGVSLAVSANTISNVGLNVQKKAHSKRQAGGGAPTKEGDAKSSTSKDSAKKSIDSSEENHDIPQAKTTMSTAKSDLSHIPDKDNEPEKSYVTDGTWILGLFLQIVGALFDFAALGFAPQSVVAPLGSLTLVVNVFLARIMHNEKPNNKTLVATFVIIFGSVLTVVFSAKEAEIESINAVFDLYASANFLFYGTITGGFMLTLWGITQWMVRMSRNNRRRYKRRWYKLHRFAIASLSGTMGAQNVLIAKTTATLLVITSSGDGNMFTHWETYLVLFGLIFSIYFQLRWLNSGLKRFSALHIVPTFQSYWITVSVMGGLVVYKEFQAMNSTTKMVFPIGVLITIGGVAYLTTQGNPEKLAKAEESKRERLKQQYNEELSMSNRSGGSGGMPPTTNIQRGISGQLTEGELAEEFEYEYNLEYGSHGSNHRPSIKDFTHRVDPFSPQVASLDTANSASNPVKTEVVPAAVPISNGDVGVERKEDGSILDQMTAAVSAQLSARNQSNNPEWQKNLLDNEVPSPAILNDLEARAMSAPETKEDSSLDETKPGLMNHASVPISVERSKPRKINGRQNSAPKLLLSTPPIVNSESDGRTRIDSSEESPENLRQPPPTTAPTSSPSNRPALSNILSDILPPSSLHRNLHVKLPTMTLPSAQQMLHKLKEFGDASVIGGVSLGRLLVAPDEFLPNSDIGVDYDDISFLFSPPPEDSALMSVTSRRNTEDGDADDNDDPNALETPEFEKRRRHSIHRTVGTAEKRVSGDGHSLARHHRSFSTNPPKNNDGPPPHEVLWAGLRKVFAKFELERAQMEPTALAIESNTDLHRSSVEPPSAQLSNGESKTPVETPNEHSIGGAHTFDDTYRHTSADLSAYTRNPKISTTQMDDTDGVADARKPSVNQGDIRINVENGVVSGTDDDECTPPLDSNGAMAMDLENGVSPDMTLDIGASMTSLPSASPKASVDMDSDRKKRLNSRDSLLAAKKNKDGSPDVANYRSAEDTKI